MVAKGRKKGTVRFAVQPGNGVKRALLAGSFNDWRLLRMRKQKDGSFVSVVPIPGGTHEYKFLLDNEWIVDPDNSAWAMNSYGTMNSVVTVE